MAARKADLRKLVSLFLTIIGAMIASTCCADTWSRPVGWTLSGPAALSCSADSNTIAWDTSTKLQSTWAVSADIAFTHQTSDIGSSRLVFGDAADVAHAFVTIEHYRSANFSSVSVDLLEPGKSGRILTSNWLPGSDSAYSVSVTRKGTAISVQVFGDQGLAYAETTPALPRTILRGLTNFGVAADNSEAAFSNVLAVSPAPAVDHYAGQASGTLADLLKNYWTGGPDLGFLAPTSHGYRVDGRGGMWEHGLTVLCMDNLYIATRDPLLLRRIAAEWNWTKQHYTTAELEAAGTDIHPASDDTGWDAYIYMVYYRDLGDSYALTVAEGLVDNGYKRWLSDDLGGGMWYDNSRTIKSLYETAIVLASLSIWDETHDKSYYDRAFSCYEWMESHLLRPDGLYWCDRSADGPLGKEQPDHIGEAGSVTFLAGNMAMAVLHAWFYRQTGLLKYLLRAQRTVQAIARRETRNGVYIDDRDAWTDGSFAGEWASEVLTLPGVSTEDRDTLLRSADSIAKYDRTPDGFYGGGWSGPADGPGSHWSMLGSRPQQAMTSGSAANIIMAAALLKRWIDTSPSN